MEYAELRERYMALEGRKAAAWLVRGHRKSFHRAGRVRFFIATGVPLPRYMQFAFAAFRASRKWEVVERDEGERTVWWVRWKGWLTNGSRARARARNERKRDRRRNAAS